MLKQILLITACIALSTVSAMGQGGGAADRSDPDERGVRHRQDDVIS
jgi:hypothetical protein